MALGHRAAPVLVLPVHLDQTRRRDLCSAAAVASAPLTNARLRPCAVISRRTIISPPSGVEDAPGWSRVSSPVRTRSARRARAKQQSDGFDEDRLAGARFARQDVQAGLELDLDAVDDGEVFDAQVAQHGGERAAVTGAASCARLEKRRKFHRSIPLKAFRSRVTLTAIALSQRRITLCGGGVRCARLACTSLHYRCRVRQGPTRRPARMSFELVARSSPVSKLVLLVLILFSVTSWGIILFKLWALNRAERAVDARFLTCSAAAAKFSEVQAVCKNLSESPLVGIFQAGYAELNTQLRQGVPPDRAPPSRRARDAQEPAGPRSRPAARGRRRSEQAREPRVVPRDDGEHHAVHRPVRHGLGHHGRLPGHRPDRLDEPRASSRPASPTRSSPRPRASSRRFRRSTSTTTSRRA